MAMLHFFLVHPVGWLGDHHSVDDMVVNVHPHVALQMFFSAFCSYIGYT